MALFNFINPEILRDADAARLNASGQSAALDSIRKAHRNGPFVGDPVALGKAAKGVSAARVKNPNADDAIDKDEDEDADDMDLDEDEDEDLAVRRKARKEADRKLRSNADAAKRAIKSIHDNGPRSEDPDAIIKAQATRMRYRDSRPSFVAIKKAQESSMSMQKLFTQGNNNHPIDEADVQRIIAQGKREIRKSAGIPSAVWNAMTGAERQAAMGKAQTSIRFSSAPSFPANSANGEWGATAIADTGAANNWDDENTQSPAVGHAGGFSDSAISPNDPRIAAAVDSVGTPTRAAAVTAIRADWARARAKQAHQAAASFAARPAAHVDDAQKSLSLRDLGARVGDEMRKAFAR
jgi:hypothetical protein